MCNAGNGQARPRLVETVGTMLTFCLMFSEMKFAVVIVLSVCVVLAMARPDIDLEKLSAQCSLSVLCFQK